MSPFVLSEEIYSDAELERLPVDRTRWAWRCDACGETGYGLRAESRAVNALRAHAQTRHRGETTSGVTGPEWIGQEPGEA